MYLRIVQACENALFRNPQATRQHGKVQAVVGLQRIIKETADQIYHLIIISSLERLIQRYIILINQQNGFLSIVLFEKQGECLQAANQRSIRHVIDRLACCSYFNQSLVGILFRLRQALAFKQKLESHGFFANHIGQCRQCCFEIQAAHAFQADGDHGEFSHIFFTQSLFLHDLQPIKQRRIAPYLKKAFQHAHIQRFPKTPGAGKKIYLSPVLQ